MLLNFDFPQLPIQGGCDIGEPRLVLCLIPCEGRGQTIWTLLNWRNLNHRVRKYEITPETPIEVLFAENSSTTLALDEDTFTAPARIRFKVADPVRFVTGTSFGTHSYRENVCKTPEEDLFLTGFAPDGEMLAARLGRLLRKGAKAATNHRSLYPRYKHD